MMFEILESIRKHIESLESQVIPSGSSAGLVCTHPSPNAGLGCSRQNRAPRFGRKKRRRTPKFNFRREAVIGQDTLMFAVSSCRRENSLRFQIAVDAHGHAAGDRPGAIPASASGAVMGCRGNSVSSTSFSS
jgi:hypothetical protein